MKNSIDGEQPEGDPDGDGPVAVADEQVVEASDDEGDGSQHPKLGWARARLTKANGEKPKKSPRRRRLDPRPPIAGATRTWPGRTAEGRPDR